MTLADSVVMEKVGTEVYGPIFAAGGAIVFVTMLSVAVVSYLIDISSADLAAEFDEGNVDKLEEEFGVEAARQVKDGDGIYGSQNPAPLDASSIPEQKKQKKTDVDSEDLYDD